MPNDESQWPPAIEELNTDSAVTTRPASSAARVLKFAVAGAVYGAVAGALFLVAWVFYAYAVEPVQVRAMDGFNPLMMSAAGVVGVMVGGPTGLILGILVRLLVRLRKTWPWIGLFAVLPCIPIDIDNLLRHSGNVTRGFMLLEVPETVGPAVIAAAVLYAWAIDFERDHPRLPLIGWMRT